MRFPSLNFVDVMAPNVATTELKFLMEKEGVADDILTKLVDAGVTTVKQLSVLVGSVEEMREVAKNDLGVDNSTTWLGRRRWRRCFARSTRRKPAQQK